MIRVDGFELMEWNDESVCGMEYDSGRLIR